MNATATPTKEYVKNAVLTASPEQLQLMLYDGAIRFTLRGLDGIRAQNREAAFEAFDRAQRIMLELSSGINRDVNPALADRMGAIYNFIYRRLIAANVDLDEAAAQEALRLLRYQRETWVLLMDKIQSEVHGAAPTSNSPDVPAPPTGQQTRASITQVGVSPAATRQAAPAAGRSDAQGPDSPTRFITQG